MGYTRKEIIDKIEKSKENMQVFYKLDFINYRGKTSDTNEYYTEIVSEWLLQNIDLLNKIPTITREKGYLTKTHDGIIKNPDSNRDEEIIAMKMLRQSEISGLGKIIDYQTPLKNKSKDPIGKIDLLSYDGKTLRILELKKPDSNETMLRCVIEGYTYRKTVDKEKLLDSFKLPPNTIVKAHPLVFVGGTQYDEMLEDRAKLKKLIKVLDCKPLYITEKNQKYIVTENKNEQFRIKDIIKGYFKI